MDIGVNDCERFQNPEVADSDDDDDHKKQQPYNMHPIKTMTNLMTEMKNEKLTVNQPQQ